MNYFGNQPSDLTHFVFFHSARGYSRCSDAKARRDEWFVLIERYRVLVDRNQRRLECLLCHFASNTFAVHPNVNKHQVIVSATGNKAQSLFLQLICESCRIRKDLSLVFFEVFAQRFAKGYSFGGDDMHKRSALHTREQFPIDLFRVLLLAKDQSTARTTQRFVSSRGHIIGMRYR